MTFPLMPHCFIRSPLMDLWAASSFWLLQLALPWMCLYRSSFEHLFSVWGYILVPGESVAQVAILRLALQELPDCGPQRLLYVTFPPAPRRGPFPHGLTCAGSVLACCVFFITAILVGVKRHLIVGLYMS